MTDHKNMYSISAFLAGAFIGASIALILAPQTGAQLRRAIRNSADKAREEFVEAWETA